MSGGVIFIVIGILFLLGNIHWHNELYKKKVELEEEERNLRFAGVGVDLFDCLDSILESINNGLGEWQGVTKTHCPEHLIPLKEAQEETEELIRNMGVH